MITAICLTPALKERNRALRRRKPLGEFVFEGEWGGRDGRSFVFADEPTPGLKY